MIFREFLEKLKNVWEIRGKIWRKIRKIIQKKYEKFSHLKIRNNSVLTKSLSLSQFAQLERATEEEEKLNFLKLLFLAVIVTVRLFLFFEFRPWRSCRNRSCWERLDSSVSTLFTTYSISFWNPLRVVAIFSFLKFQKISITEIGEMQLCCRKVFQLHSNLVMLHIFWKLSQRCVHWWCLHRKFHGKIASKTSLKVREKSFKKAEKYKKIPWNSG